MPEPDAQSVAEKRLERVHDPDKLTRSERIAEKRRLELEFERELAEALADHDALFSATEFLEAADYERDTLRTWYNERVLEPAGAEPV
jgi:hypothetical protein